MSSFPADVLMDLRERMVRIETKLDTQAENDVQTAAKVDSQEVRLQKLEGGYRLLASLGAIGLFLVTFFQAPLQRMLGM